MLDLTRRSVELEARLIDDLLDVTRISRGKLQLHRETVDAHALLQQAVEICRDEIASSGLRLERRSGGDRNMWSMPTPRGSSRSSGISSRTP